MRPKDVPLEMPLLPLWVLDTISLFDNDEERTNLLSMMKQYWETGIELKPIGNERYPWPAIRMWLDNEKNNPQRIRKSLEYKEWRTKVFERDDYKCRCCGQVGGVLNAHHIQHFAKHPKLRFEISNGITLCAECHKKIHNGTLGIAQRCSDKEVLFFFDNSEA